MSDLVYLYAVVTNPPPETDIGGIDERPVRWIAHGQLSAAVSDVPADEFEQTPLNANIKDMAWLAPRAVAHQEVNHRIHELAEAVIPLAFGSVFRDDERVRTLLRSQSTAFEERLHRLRGKSEWVVGLYRTGAPEHGALDDVSAAVRDLRAEVASAAPGRAHLLKRRLAEMERDEQRRVDGDVAREVLRELEQVTQDVYREPIPDEAIDRPLLRGSLLVSRSNQTALVELVEALQQRWQRHGYQLQLTGPWPPYRFAGLPADDRNVANVSS